MVTVLLFSNIRTYISLHLPYWWPWTLELQPPLKQQSQTLPHLPNDVWNLRSVWVSWLSDPACPYRAANFQSKLNQIYHLCAVTVGGTKLSTHLWPNFSSQLRIKLGIYLLPNLSQSKHSLSQSIHSRSSKQRLRLDLTRKLSGKANH